MKENAAGKEQARRRLIQRKSSTQPLIMAKKHILFITSIFFLGTLGTGLCLTFSSKVTPNCCPTKGSSSGDSEDCFSHCAKQKVVTVKIKSLL